MMGYWGTPKDVLVMLSEIWRKWVLLHGQLMAVQQPHALQLHRCVEKKPQRASIQPLEISNIV